MKWMIGGYPYDFENLRSSSDANDNTPRSATPQHRRNGLRIQGCSNQIGGFNQQKLTLPNKKLDLNLICWYDIYIYMYVYIHNIIF